MFGSTARGKDWMLGWEFGAYGYNGRRHKSRRHPAHPELSNTSQYPRWRGNKQAAGWFVFPMVRASGPWIATAYVQAIEGFLRRNGLTP